MSDITVLRTNKTGGGFVKENARLGEIADEYDYMK